MTEPQRRRQPSQDRSREKCETIIRAARDLIGERGNDAVSMREIARQAGVPISSIYQYFPDKKAILAAIMEGYFEQIRGLIRTFADTSSDLGSLIVQTQRGSDGLYQLFRGDPALATLWAGLQANPDLRELDAEDSRRNAAILAGKITGLFPKADPDEVYDSMLLLSHGLGMTVRIALSLEEPEGQRLFNEFKRIVSLRLQSFAGSEPASVNEA